MFSIVVSRSDVSEALCNNVSPLKIKVNFTMAPSFLGIYLAIAALGDIDRQNSNYLFVCITGQW